MTDFGAPAFNPSGLPGAAAASRYVGATASGAPVSGTFALGDWVIDQTGANFVCTVAGSPGTWVNSVAVLAAQYALVKTVGNRFDAQSAVTTTLAEGNLAGTPAGASGANGVFYFDPNEWGTGMTPSLNLRGLCTANATASTSTFTIGLYPVTPGGGGAAAVNVNLGSVIAASQVTFTFTTLAATSMAQAASGDFAAPAAGFYVIGLIIAGSMAASSSVRITAQLSRRSHF